MNQIMTQEEVFERYGEPGNWADFVRFYPPFPMRISWDMDKSITSFYVHRSLTFRLGRIFQALLEHYGYEKIKALGVDIYGGCYNYRKMRRGSKWSRHSWAIAIDLDPANNRLTWKADNSRTPQPRFANPEYEKMHEIFESNGMVNYGRVKNYDWMHFEVAKT